MKYKRNEWDKHALAITIPGVLFALFGFKIVAFFLAFVVQLQVITNAFGYKKNGDLVMWYYVKNQSQPLVILISYYLGNGN